MQVLVTGATGYVGSRVARSLVARGDTVAGSARSMERARALPAGVEPVALDFDEPEPWGEAAARADAVVHTAFASHDADWGRAVEREAIVVASLVRAMAGSGKALVVANGTLFLGDSDEGRLDEAAPVPPDHPAAARAAATAQVRGPGTAGFRGVEVRLASFVYGHGGSVFLPKLVAAARRDGRSIVVGDGAVRTSTLHVEDAAAAFVLALDRGRAGGVYHVAAPEEPSVREIAEAVAVAAGGVPVVPVGVEEAAAALDPFTAWFLTTNNRLDAGLARAELGWRPGGHPPLLEDVARGSYARG